MTSPDALEPTPLRLALRRQQLRSERLRVRLFLVLLSLLLVMPTLLTLVPGLVSDSLQPGLRAARLPLTLMLAFFLVYEGLVLLWLNRLLATDRTPPAFFPYLNTFIELSLPTTALLVGGAHAGALTLLSGGIPMVYFLLLCLATLNLDTRLCVYAGAVAAVQFWLASQHLLSLAPPATGIEAPWLAMLHSPHQYAVKSLFLLLGGGIAGFVASQLQRQLRAGLQSLQERDRAVSIFGQHVSPQVADLLLKQPLDASGQEREVCVMFLDIRDFSRLAGVRSPAEVMDYLNTLFSCLIPLVNQHHGIINKFLGDGFMAVFGAPLDDQHPCANAVRAARSILAEVDALNQKGAILPTRLGIGLHLGVAITGNVGGGERKEYTVIGDVVNLAARIEQATKSFSAQLLVSEAVFANLTQETGEDLGLVELKGQSQPARLFKLA